MDKELKLAEKKRLQLYLKQFWVKPLKDPSLLKMANIFNDKPTLKSLSVYSPDPELLKAFAQRVLLSFGNSLFWENLEAYSLVEEYIAGGSTVSSHLDSDVLIIDFGVNNTPNKMLMPLVNGLIATRESRGLYTLILCHRTNPELVPQPVTISTSGSSNRRGEII